MKTAFFAAFSALVLMSSASDISGEVAQLEERNPLCVTCDIFLALEVVTPLQAIAKTCFLDKKSELDCLLEVIVPAAVMYFANYVEYIYVYPIARLGLCLLREGFGGILECVVEDAGLFAAEVVTFRYCILANLSVPCYPNN